MIYKEFTAKGTRDENEDSLFLYTKETNTAVRHLDLGETFIVADGMGGHAGGKEASSYVGRRFYEYYYSKDNVGLEDPEEICELLKNILKKINREMSDPEVRNPSKAGWGTTISLLILMDNRYFYAHCGDTRIYRLSQDKSELLTIDQNAAYQLYFVQDKLTYEEYLESSAQNMLLSYMGQNSEEISIKSGWDYYNETDIFLLSSDGLNEFFEKKDIEDIRLDKNLSNKENLELIENKFWNKNSETSIDEEKSKDNITYILVTPEQKQPEKTKKTESFFQKFITGFSNFFGK